VGNYICSTLTGYRPQAGGVDVANERDNGQHVRPVADVRIRRGRILEDAIAQILPLGPVARGRLAVRYVNAAVSFFQSLYGQLE